MDGANEVGMTDASRGETGDDGGNELEGEASDGVERSVSISIDSWTSLSSSSSSRWVHASWSGTTSIGIADVTELLVLGHMEVILAALCVIKFKVSWANAYMGSPIPRPEGSIC